MANAFGETFLSLTCNKVDNKFLKDPCGEGQFGSQSQFHTFCFGMIKKTLHFMNISIYCPY